MPIANGSGTLNPLMANLIANPGFATKALQACPNLSSCPNLNTLNLIKPLRLILNVRRRFAFAALESGFIQFAIERVSRIR